MARQLSLLFLSIALVSLAGCTKSRTPRGDAGGSDAGFVLDGGPGVDAGGDLSGCAVPSDCVVVPASCCGSCGQAARGDAIAVHVDRAGDYRRAACGSGTACPACAAPRDPTLVATCSAGRCQVVDVYEHPSTACMSSDECRVRTRDCCECGGDATFEGLIAISDPSAYEALVCDPGMGCPECAPVYPPEATPTCRAGHCEVSWPR